MMYYLENHRNSKLVNRKTRKIQATAKHDRNALVLKDILEGSRIREFTISLSDPLSVQFYDGNDFFEIYAFFEDGKRGTA